MFANRCSQVSDFVLLKSGSLKAMDLSGGGKLDIAITGTSLCGDHNIMLRTTTISQHQSENTKQATRKHAMS